MKWKFWKHPPAPVQVQVLQRDPCKLRLSEWRSDPNLCAAAAKVLLDPTVRLMLDVLTNEHIAFLVLPPAAPEHMRAAYQAKCEGYTLALGNIEAMANFQPSPKDLEATFEPEEQRNTL